VKYAPMVLKVVTRLPVWNVLAKSNWGDRFEMVGSLALRILPAVCSQ
jgi:hypothetical protein